jgi:hypothetical protein
MLRADSTYARLGDFLSVKIAGGIKLAFLTDDELANLSIRRMILHAVSDDEFTPELEFESVEEEPFFLERIRDTDASALFSFQPDSLSKPIFEQMGSATITFQDGAQQLAALFAHDHDAGMKPGALFMFELDTGAPQSVIYSMVKYDYREAIERSDDADSDQKLRRIVEAFIADRRALQKSCLIRVVDGVADAAVSARDLLGRAPDLAVYFANFLGVRRDRSETELSQAAAEALRIALLDLVNHLPDRDVARALGQAKEALRNRPAVDDAALVDAALAGAGNPTDDAVISEIRTRVERAARQKKITGLSFRPDRSVLRRAHRTRLQTHEGVVVEYPANLLGTRVVRQPGPDGGETITITTERSVNATPIRDTASGATGSTS